MKTSKGVKKVFVYGTLKEGGFYSVRFDGNRVSSVEAVITGASLYSTADGLFPAMKLEGVGVVKGEVHEYKAFARTIRRIDQIEGYRPDDPERSLYIRRVVEAETASGKEQVYAYTYNESVKKSDKVKSGIWNI